MPSVQTVDMSPIPRREETALERGAESFSSRFMQNRRENLENDALKDLYSQYQNDGKNIENAIMRAKTNPNLSPTTKVNEVNQLLKFQEYNKELQEKEKKKTENREIIADLEKRQGLQPGSLAAYEPNPAMAVQVTKQPKATQASQPINEDQLKRINYVENLPEFKNASTGEKQRLYRNAGVSKENIDSISTGLIEDTKNEEGREYNKLREKAVSEYVNKSMETGELAEDQQLAISESRKAIESNNITGPGFTALMKDNPYGQLLVGLTPDESLLQSANKKMLEGSKGLFGPKPTEREIFLLLNTMLPAIGKSKEANLVGLNFIEKVNDMKLMRAQIVDELTEGGSKYVPNIQQEVSKQMKPYVDSLKQELTLAEQKYGKESTDQKIKVTAPDGSIGHMTQAQIDKAKESNVIFTPTK